MSDLLAYIGPGGGFAFMGAFLSLVVAIASGLLSLAVWPIRVGWRTLRGWRAHRRARVKRIIYLGLDGLDPRLTERFMAEGKLPHLSALAEQGGYQRLRTTFPCLSPVAWSCFATGVNPARHNIFDFLHRNQRTYHPELSSARVRPATRWLKLGPLRLPLERARIDNHRKSVPFWKLLGDANIRSTVLRVPITFPPERFNGHLLSAMCTPDLRGTQGSFTFYSTAIREPSFSEGERRPLVVDRDVWRGEIHGPHQPGSTNGAVQVIPFEIRRRRRGGFELRLAGATVPLTPGRYSEWVPLTFRTGLSPAAHGIVRALLTETGDDLELYLTPINIDPARPALPISYPSYYAAYLSKLLGRYATLGLAEDTWALNERVIDEDAFLEQAWLNHDEREAMFFNALDKTRRGVVACVFDASDRIQHMFFRCSDETHPANRDRDAQKYASVIEDTYRRLDDLVGRAAAHVDEHTLFVVLSDHGFASFRRGVNLNAWLRDHGYLALVNDGRTSDRFFDRVDWSRTRAYALGLGGLYINVKGREAHGIVPREEAAALRREIAEALSGLEDPAGGVAVQTAVPAADLYRGPYLDAAPDLLVGYNEGYRASWGTAVGEVGEDVFEDNERAWGGDHCIDPRLVPGVFFANKKISKEEPGLEDFAPTTLTAFGMDVPAHMEGDVLFEDFQEARG